jgi:hypothetical protein
MMTSAPCAMRRNIRRALPCSALNNMYLRLMRYCARAFCPCSTHGATNVATKQTQVCARAPWHLPAHSATGVPLLACSACNRRFHLECAGIAAARQEKWKCRHCLSAPALSASDRRSIAGSTGALPLPAVYFAVHCEADEASKMKARTSAMRKLHASLKFRASAFFFRERARFEPFVPAARLQSLVRDAREAEEAVSAAALTMDSSATHLAGKNLPSILTGCVVTVTPIGFTSHIMPGCLRGYQLAGVNWLLQQCAAQFLQLPKIAFTLRQVRSRYRRHSRR